MTTTLSNSLKQSAAATQWEKIGIKHHHGINLPLFSLWSKKSCGVGEFLDLLPLIDWSAEIGFDVVQLLPLNDPGEDTSPYNAISSCALNPLHLSLTALPEWEKDSTLKELVRELQELNKKEFVDWKNVREKKEAFLDRYKELHFKEIADSSAYTAFLSSNPWVRSYAEFKVLKQVYQTKNWQNWPKKLDLLDVKQVDKQCFIQFLCFKQMSQVKSYAKEKGVFLKGDIPILISPDSADVWSENNLFDLEKSAGAPPDMYSEEGQNWGFPLYRWEEHRASNFYWWRQRLRVASNLYHLYRIDHIVGFFRIWAISHGKKATEGAFEPADENVWVEHGQELLQMMLDASSMLPIGEDLGSVPDRVRECLQSMGICGTRVVRWERDWKGDLHFEPPTEFPKTSMTTVSTHDSETLSEWWRNEKDYAEYKGWKRSEEISHELRFELLLESHRSRSLFHINMLQEYLELREGFGREGRVNVPGELNEENWAYRFALPVEKFAADQKLKQLMLYLRGPL